ncbi:acetoacetate-CoA ligase [Phialophora macrospora]|uniref:Acetoacetate-CoA ligase n=1 Tax=Phialophora macrospora TaxID=1851006 RepID=A0A0D2FD90_9EURO|nr:acetoacetate-CoA ligase [Phialophora macrospora]
MAQERGQGPTWTPSTDISHLAVERFRRFVEVRQRTAYPSYEDLHSWSVRNLNDFWILLWEFADIKCSSPPDMITVDETVPMDRFPPFFKRARLNFAENVLDQGRQGAALKAFSELSAKGQCESISWSELRQRVRTTADALHGSGVQQHDAVAYIGSNTADAVIVLLAAAAIGAIFTSLAGDMGEIAVLDRLRQIKPKILFTVDGYQYNGRWYDCMARATRVSQALSTNSTGTFDMVVMSNGPHRAAQSVQRPSRGTTYASFLQRARQRKTEFVQLPFSHPLLILFSSGTTGAPKGMVHGHGGVTLNLKTEHLLYENLGPNDIYYHYSNIGWTMWNIFFGGLLTGATLVLYDGSPFYPTPANHIENVLSSGTTVFGASPRYYSELKDRGIKPSQFQRIDQIRLLGSTGAVLPAIVWQWIASEFGNQPILSFSGGTEVCGSFIHGSLIHPHHAGEITVKKLGFDVDVFDENAQSCPPGEAGELVVKRAFPSAAIKFWNDPTYERYRAAYYAQFPGVWAHGDYAKINPRTGGIIMLGRSDGILNPSGVRFGSSEIYNLVDKFPDLIHDSLCVGQRRTPTTNSNSNSNSAGEEEEVVLFVQPKAGVVFTPEIETLLRTTIATALTPRHVPRRFYPVAKIPYNVNGKKLEIAVKKVLAGAKIDDKMRATLADPRDLDEFRRYAATAAAAAAVAGGAKARL